MTTQLFLASGAMCLHVAVERHEALGSNPTNVDGSPVVFFILHKFSPRRYNKHAMCTLLYLAFDDFYDSIQLRNLDRGNWKN